MNIPRHRFLALTVFLGFVANQAFGQQPIPLPWLTDHAVRIASSKRCGEVFALTEFPETLPSEMGAYDFLTFSGRQRVKYKRSLRHGFKRQALSEFSYRTPEGKVFINHPDASTWKEKQAKEYLATHLAARLRERALVRFNAETQDFQALHLDPLSHHLEKMAASLFPDASDHPNRQIHLLMTFYPEMRGEIIDEAKSDLRPLLCHYEDARHQRKIIMRWSNTLIVAALGLGVASAVVGTQGIAAPALVVAAGVAAVSLGLRDITWGLYNLRHREKSAKIAGRFKMLLTETRKTIKSLQKKAQTTELGPAEQELLSKLEEIDQSFPKEREKRLRKVARSKHFNRLIIAFGILNAGFNGLNLTGDATLLTELPETLLGLMGVI